MASEGQRAGLDGTLGTGPWLRGGEAHLAHSWAGLQGSPLTLVEVQGRRSGIVSGWV